MTFAHHLLFIHNKKCKNKFPQEASAGNNSIDAYGQLQHVSDALSGLTYAGPSSDFSGDDTVSIKVVDAGGLTASRIIKIEVEASSPPQITRVGRLASLGRTLNVDEDDELSLDSFRISVSNSATDSMVQVEIFCTNGVVSLPRSGQESELSVSTSTGQGVVVAGNTDVVNRVMRSLVYRPDANIWGSDELSIVAREGRRDSGNPNAGWNTVPGIESFIILIEPVNDPPVIDIPIGLAGEEFPTALAGEMLSLEGIIVHDADAAEPEGSQLVSINASTGDEQTTISLAMGSSTVQGRIPGVRFLEGSAEGVYSSIAFRAPLHLANSALNLLQFGAPFGLPSGLRNVTITVSDHGNWGKGTEEIVSSSVIIDLQYQQDPLHAFPGGFVHLDTPHGALSVDEDGHLHDLGITLRADFGADQSGNSTWVDVTLAVDHGLVQVSKIGALVSRNADIEVIRHGPGSLTFSGGVAEVSAALVNSSYMPEPDFYGMETLELLVQEHIGDGVMNASVEILVLPQPDLPTLTLDIPEGLTVEGGSQLQLYGVEVQHVDALDDFGSDTVALRARSTTGSGTITMNGIQPGLWVYAEEAGRVLVARGTVENLQVALDSGALEYGPADGYDGLDVVALSVSTDSPYGAFGDELPSSVEEDDFGVGNSSTVELNITVAPAFVPGAVLLENGPLFRTVEGSGVEIAGMSVRAPGRRDTSDVVVSVSFETAEGGVTLPGAASGPVVATGQGESTMSLTGKELEVNMALAGAVFQGDAFYNGVADIKVTDVDCLQVAMFCWYCSIVLANLSSPAHMLEVDLTKHLDG